MSKSAPDAVADRLRAWAKGMYTTEAGVELLLRAFGGRSARPGNPWIVDDEHSGYWVDFHAIPDHVGALSGGERRLLLIAASLGVDDEPIQLGALVSGLDRGDAALVLAAISHANGSHEHTEFVPIRGRRRHRHDPPDQSADQSGPAVPVASVRHSAACAPSHR